MSRCVRSTGRFWAVTAVAVFVAAGVAGCGSSKSSSSTGTTAPSGHALLVGTFNGHAGQYTTIQDAVNAAQPGDWVLVAPGDYHEGADHSTAPTNTEAGGFGGVLISTSNVHLRGMDRNGVIVDGTKASASTPCSSNAADQDLGATGSDGKALGRNGIVAWKADGVTIDNLTTCNFLAGCGQRRQRHLVERGSRLGHDRRRRVLGHLPHGHVQLLR